MHIFTSDAIIALEEIEYLVNVNNNRLSVPITASATTSQDIIVEVNITDETAIGNHIHML